jgi:serine/threonine-protein kinase mTOR
MLIFAKKTLKTRVKPSWLESLGRCSEALDEYTLRCLEESGYKDGGMTLIRCSNALGNWETVLSTAQFMKDSGKTISEVSHYAARAALQLGKLDEIQTYAENINTKYEDPNFYYAITSIFNKEYEKSQTYIKKARVYVENNLIELSSVTYNNCYDKIVRL